MANYKRKFNGNENGETVVSTNFRVGMKREFTWVMKAKEECEKKRITRSHKNMNNIVFGENNNDNNEGFKGLNLKGLSMKKKKPWDKQGKKVEGLVTEEEAEGEEIKSDIDYTNSDDEVMWILEKSKDGIVNPMNLGTNGILDNGVSGNTYFRGFTGSIKLEDLLGTGLLEGLVVHWSISGLRGVIQGSGILCFCDDCRGRQVVSPNQFELHACGGNGLPPENMIYLVNKKSLHDILNVCKDCSSDSSLELAIRNAVGWSQAKATDFLNCKGSKSTDDRLPSIPVSSRKSSGKVYSISHPRKKAQGKLTIKDLRLHKVVFESNLLADGCPLGYYIKGKHMLSGYKLGSGIFCYCCNRVVSPSLFEAHAGFASRRQPYLQIYTSEGVSLHEWALALKRNWQSSTDKSDDVCSICQGTGELLCCDMCPRAFHTGCLDLSSIPEGTWYCRCCVNMIQKKNSVKNVNAVAAGRVAGIDPVEEVKKRCVRIIGVSEPEVGGCALCQGHDFNESEFCPRTVIICDQCEKGYHVGCLKEYGMDELKVLPDDKWFCCRGCSSIDSALQQLVNDGENKLPDSLLNIKRKKHEDNASEDKSDLNISWRLLHGKMALEESRKWLCAAVSVFHDRFNPIGDSNNSDHDLIPLMVYGKNNGDQDFGGMYCAVLTVNSIVVSAAIFRIFGQEVAEIPLVATSKSCQGKGYFKALFCCIENLLASLNVRDLVLPAAHEAESMWIKKFGFGKISSKQLKEFQKDYQMMIFLGTSVLGKTVSKLYFADSALR